MTPIGIRRALDRALKDKHPDIHARMAEDGSLDRLLKEFVDGIETRKAETRAETAEDPAWQAIEDEDVREREARQREEEAEGEGVLEALERIDAMRG